MGGGVENLRRRKDQVRARWQGHAVFVCIGIKDRFNILDELPIAILGELCERMTGGRRARRHASHEGFDRRKSRLQLPGLAADGGRAAGET